MLLLLLTLALLGTPTCWARDMYGFGGGRYFSSNESDDFDITGIRVCFGLAGLMKNIQLKLGSSWGETYGVSCGNAQEFNLWPGEYFVSVSGHYRLLLRSLVFHTSQGRTASFGWASGQAFSAFPSEGGQVLTGIFGEYSLLGITGIGFLWNFPLVESTSKQTPSSNLTTPEML